MVLPLAFDFWAVALRARRRASRVPFAVKALWS